MLVLRLRLTALRCLGCKNIFSARQVCMSVYVWAEKLSNQAHNNVYYVHTGALQLRSEIQKLLPSPQNPRRPNPAFEREKCKQKIRTGIKMIFSRLESRIGANEWVYVCSLHSLLPSEKGKIAMIVKQTRFFGGRCVCSGGHDIFISA